MRILIIDFDGCIGSEEKYMAPPGGRAFLRVSSRDCTALRRLVAGGVRVIIVTASESPLIRDFADRYGCELISSKNKLASISMLLGDDITSAVAVGDDLGDAGFMEAAGVAFCPGDAHPRLLQWFRPLKSRGGAGVVQEVEMILKEKLKLNGQYSYFVAEG